MEKAKPFAPFWMGLISAVGYGIFARLAFGSEQFSTLFGTISVGFLFFVPLALGALTVYFPAHGGHPSWPYAIFAPWVPCFLFAILAAIFTWEAWICIIMALPIFLVMATLGGIFMHLLVRSANETEPPPTRLTGLLLLLIFPFVLTPLETHFPAADSLRVVHTQIEVEAAPETIWRQITRVSPITEAEHRFSFFHLAGLPRPYQATLTYDGVGGVRHGQWEDGLAFTETISRWAPNQFYVMRMEADTHTLAASPLPLKEIGGRYFDVVEGEYRLEPLGEGRVILHFTSTYRLSTRFNGYAGLWTDFFMRDVQTYILRIMKARSELAQ